MKHFFAVVVYTTSFFVGIAAPVRGDTGASADLFIRLEADESTVFRGRETRYRLVVGNAGPATVTGARVTLPDVPGARTLRWECSPTEAAFCSFRGTGAIDSRIGLVAGHEVTFSVLGLVEADATSEILQSARVRAPAGVIDPQTSDNTARRLLPVVSSITGRKEVSGRFVEGGEVTYTVTLTNHTPITQPDNPGPELFDPLPSEFVPLDFEADSGHVEIELASHSIEWNGTIPGGATVTVQIRGLVAPGTAGREVTNQGEIRFSLAGDASNDGLALTEAPGGGATVFQVLTALEIPTVDSVGLLLLGLLLAGAAIRRLR